MSKSDDSSASTPPSSRPSHPAQTVGNIKQEIPLILDWQTVQYSIWAELFRFHCQAFNVLDHINPTLPCPSDLPPDVWTTLDSLVRKWIYNTITLDLTTTILHPGDTAQQAWDRLKSIFHDNKNTRAVYLENQFNSLHLNNFSDVSAYCNKLKTLEDQLAGVDHAISDHKLVLRMVAGLRNTKFDTIAALISQTDPLPTFEMARSRLLLEESRCAVDDDISIASFVTQIVTNTSSPPLPLWPLLVVVGVLVTIQGVVALEIPAVATIVAEVKDVVPTIARMPLLLLLP